VFYLKLLLIAAAMLVLVRISRCAHLDAAEQAGASGPASSRTLNRLAVASLLCWTGAIFAGRLLAYTYTRLTVSD
jgi:hypothetical protein